MNQQVELFLTPKEASSDDEVKRKAAEALHIPLSSVTAIRRMRQSIDARHRPLRVRLVAEVYCGEQPEALLPVFDFRDVRNAPEVHIVGAGPAGLFAALKLLELGLKPVILERGKPVRERRRDLALITREHTVNPDSNYCFGEGGAGTYSDGKLYTRSGKRGDIQRILQLFVQHGAEANILYEAHPHIGTNKLPHIIERIRETILHFGGEILFNSRLTDLELQNGQVSSLLLADGTRLVCKSLILATGHSARDVFELLHRHNILIEAKPFALGVRIEHPQELIDSIQYHCDKRGPYLAPASYSLVEQVDGRGVFSFCMCPGGIIAPAATNPGEIVVNGWSPSKRNNPFANSGMVVAVGETDFKPFSAFGELAAMKYQQEAEQKAYSSVHRGLTAPAQRLTDFVMNRGSSTLPPTSYLPGVAPVKLDDILPPVVASALRKGLQAFGKKMRGYYTEEAVLVGVESRTSSPVRIPRNRETLQHPQVSNLYPCAEGAGYAGGIVSAAMDGERCALAIATVLKQKQKS